MIYSPNGLKEENLESRKNKKKLREIYRNSELDRKAAASKISSEKYKSRIEAINNYLPRGSQDGRLQDEKNAKRRRDEFSAESTAEHHRTEDMRYQKFLTNAQNRKSNSTGRAGVLKKVRETSQSFQSNPLQNRLVHKSNTQTGNDEARGGIQLNESLPSIKQANTNAQRVQEFSKKPSQAIVAEYPRKA